MTAPTAGRRIILCADDYGIAPGVNAAIRDLIAQGRLNATSVMTVAPAFTQEDVGALAALRDGAPAFSIGLHLTLTFPFQPSAAGFRPVHDNRFLRIGPTLRAAMLHRFDAAALREEIANQFAAFEAAFGRAPDFVDGHQHVHLLPQVRDAVLDVTFSKAPHAWVRQCGWPGRWPRLSDPKGMLIAAFSRAMRAGAAQKGLRSNPAFAGTYNYTADADFASVFPAFVDGMPTGGLVMCHPGTVDDTLRAVDPLTDIREREYAYLASAAFPRVLVQAGVALA
jgi:chitin disaccharide deacetylase